LAQTQILVIDDDADVRRLLVTYLVRSGYEVREARDAAEGLKIVGSAAPDVVLLDLNLPDRPGIDVLRAIRATAELLCVVVITGEHSVERAVAALKDGADNFVTKPLDLEVLLAIIHKAEESLLLRRHLVAQGEPGGAAARFASTKNAAIRRIADVLPQIAASDGNVLITGESGTGKSLLARAIKELSPRRDKPFIDVNCASLSRELLESELFGHAAGAFTGAVRSKPGLIEVADEGTLFLDEIGDMDIQVQPKLLMAIEDRQIRRVGSTEGHRVDVRIIAATHFDLQAAVREGRFRSDLYFRLDVLRVHVPPLRERREDIPDLAREFLQGLRTATPIRGFAPDVIDWLREQQWPGNLREMRNVIERAAIYATDGMIRLANLSISGILAGPTPINRGLDDDDLTLDGLEARHIVRVLGRTKGNKSEAARVLGITRQTLLRKMRVYRIAESVSA
jgi:DNA-binding NtrC family response regulator